MISRILAAVVFTAPLIAQQPAKPDSTRHPPMGPGPMSGMMMDGSMMEEMAPAMMHMMLFAPQHLLSRREALDLTSQQVAQLGAVRDRAKTAQDAAMAEARTHVKELEQAASSAMPDTTALKAHFQATHGAMGRAHWAMLAAAVQARALLTEAQRTKMRVWADSMRAWMQQHGQMMNSNRPH